VSSEPFRQRFRISPSSGGRAEIIVTQASYYITEKMQSYQFICKELYLHNLTQRTGQTIHGFTDEALAALLHYEWPGNVRELKNLLEATLINHPSAWISVAELPESFRKRLSGDDTCPQGERERVLWALHTTNWQRSVAAQKLQWSRMTLYRKMVKYQIAREDRRQQRGNLGNGHT